MLDYTISAPQVHISYGKLKFVYQGHLVKAKVMALKSKNVGGPRLAKKQFVYK